MKLNGLFCFVGESFRIGSFGSRVTATEESIPRQELATKSHLAFMSRLENQVNVKIKLVTYNTPLNDTLIKWYGKYETESLILSDLVGIAGLYEKVRELSLKENNIDFIFIIRIDLILKERILDVFNPKCDKILYPCVCWIQGSKTQYERRRHRVVDTMVFIPKKLFNERVGLTHEVCCFMSDDVYNNIDFMIDTYHDSNSENDRNPLYVISGREETMKWHSEGYRVCKDHLSLPACQPIEDKTKTYDNVFVNQGFLYL